MSEKLILNEKMIQTNKVRIICIWLFSWPFGILASFYFKKLKHFIETDQYNVAENFEKKIKNLFIFSCFLGIAVFLFVLIKVIR